jgi:hypothetical protein
MLAAVTCSLMTFVGVPEVSANSPSSPGGYSNAYYNSDQRTSTCDSGYLCLSRTTGSSGSTCGGECWESKFNTGSPIPWAGISNYPINTRLWSTGSTVYAVGKQARNRDVSARTACLYASYGYVPSAYYTLPYATSGFVTVSWNGWGSWAVIPNAVGWNC